MGVISIKDLLESGVHFGHQTKRWNPKMKQFIFTRRKGIHIIDLQKTADYADRAYQFVKEQTAQGKTILFVGTKKQAQEEIKKAAEKCSMPYVVYRWLGGLLTNFVTIRSSITRLKKIEKILAESETMNLTKRELLQLKREGDKLNLVFNGIKEMAKLPDIVFIIDTEKEDIALQEAKALGITIVGIIDTNGDPDNIDYPIPGNDDAIRAINLFANLIADAVLEGRKQVQMEQEGADTPKETPEGEEPILSKETLLIKEKYADYEVDEKKDIKSFETYKTDETPAKPIAQEEKTEEKPAEIKATETEKEVTSSADNSSNS
ncbi:MAG: 30S ribosomal protein S2 [bacterium]|nr:30S ribosomal protein S2 [bacterium]